MATLEIIALDEDTPQLRAPASGDSYQANRKIAIAPEANGNALAVSGFSLTGANAQALADLAGTWNTTGTPTAIKLNITDTVSNAASMLVDLRVGGASKFGVAKTGQVLSGYTAQNAPTYSFAGDPDTGWGYRGADTLSAVTGGQERLRVSSLGVDGLAGTVGSTLASGRLGLGNAGAFDTFLVRDAAGVLALRNGANPQKLRIANTYTDGSNLQVLSLATASGVFSIVAEGIGTGASGDVDIALTPLNSGKVKFGTHAALGAETVAGYITIKDAGGTVRKLAVVS